MKEAGGSRDGEYGQKTGGKMIPFGSPVRLPFFLLTLLRILLGLHVRKCIGRTVRDSINGKSRTEIPDKVSG